MKRRDALLQLGALGLSASLARGGSSAPARAATPRDDVIVIGAGLAGLYAALLLQDAGARVRVLEASGRVGGCLRSVDVAGEGFDVGATGIGPTHARVRELVRRLELPTEPTDAGVQKAVYSIQGQLVTAEQWADSPLNRTVGEEREIAPSRIDSYFLDRHLPFDSVDDWLEPRYAALDVSLGAFMQSRGLSDEALRLMNVAINCVDIWETSALPLLRDTAKWRQIGYRDARKEDLYGGSQYKPMRCVGGNEKLPQAIAAALEQPPELNRPVAAIQHSARGVVVHCIDGSRFEADKAIIAMPLLPLRGVDIQPILPEDKAGLIRNCAYSGNTQFVFRIKRPYWEQDGLPPGLWTDSPIERAFVSRLRRSDGWVMHVWINGDGARRIETIPAAAQPAFVMDLLARLRPATRGQLEFVHRQSWTTDPLYQGEKFFFSVGQVHRYFPAMATPVGPLHFAGAHHRNVDQGMEAAAQSGERAALEIIAAMKG